MVCGLSPVDHMFLYVFRYQVLNHDWNKVTRKSCAVAIKLMSQCSIRHDEMSVTCLMGPEAVDFDCPTRCTSSLMHMAKITHASLWSHNKGWTRNTTLLIPWATTNSYTSSTLVSNPCSCDSQYSVALTTRPLLLHLHNGLNIRDIHLKHHQTLK